MCAPEVLLPEPKLTHTKTLLDVEAGVIFTERVFEPVTKDVDVVVLSEESVADTSC